MIIDRAIIIFVPILAVALIIIGMVLKPSQKHAKVSPKTENIGSLFTTKGIINRLNSSQSVQDFGMKFSNNSELAALFRKSKNPWNLTPFTYNFIRYGASLLFLVFGIIFAMLFSWTFLLIFGAAAGMCFILPKNHYETIAKERESQWYQLYQFIWVLKHNLSYFDPKKTFIETSRYIDSHSKMLPELVTGFRDFADHWNGQYMDDYLKETYGDFQIANDLFDVVLTSQKTGEYPGKELESLRRVIIEKLNFHVQEVLSSVSMKSTMYSSPFLLMTVGLIILVPVIIQIMSAF